MTIISSLKNKLESNKQKIASSFAEIKIEADIRESRLNLCLACDHLFKSTNTCKKCGCFMNAKTWIKGATCPVNKW
jgi:hypothetical protein